MNKEQIRKVKISGFGNVGIPPTPPNTHDLAQMIIDRHNNKIALIKFTRQYTNMGLVEAKNFIESLPADNTFAFLLFMPIFEVWAEVSTVTQPSLPENERKILESTTCVLENWRRLGYPSASCAVVRTVEANF